jgi:hypothetical protein
MTSQVVPDLLERDHLQGLVDGHVPFYLALQLLLQ